MTQRIPKEERELIKEYQLRARKRQLENDLVGMRSRGHSISIGTAFGGVIEVSIRCDGDTNAWVLLQPVEAVELLHQLSAAVGCQLQLVPRRDFAAWRNWKNSPEELEHFRGHNSAYGDGHPPHAKALVDGGYDTNLPPPEQQPGLNFMEEPNGETMAVEVPKQRRKSKRAADAS